MASLIVQMLQLQSEVFSQLTSGARARVTTILEDCDKESRKGGWCILLPFVHPEDREVLESLGFNFTQRPVGNWQMDWDYEQ